MASDKARSRGSGTVDSEARTRASGPLKWFVRLSLTGRCMVMAGLLFVTICAFFAEENWRGRRAWEHCRRELESKGALNWQKFIPAPIPDEQNFAAIPFLAPLFDVYPKPRAPGQQRWRDEEGRERAINFATPLWRNNARDEPPVPRFEGRMTDLEGALASLRNQSNRSSSLPTQSSSRAETAATLLAALEDYRPVLEELRIASQRPGCRFNVEYDAEEPMSILLPHYGVLQRVTRVLELRASAELELLQFDASFADVMLMLRLATCTQNEPFVIGLLVRGALMKRAEQIIWEGLARSKWSEPQLRAFQEGTGKFQPLKELDWVLRAERAAFGGVAFQYIRGHKNELRALAENDSLFYLLAGPNGWLDQEQVSYHRLYDQRVLANFDPASGHVEPHLIDANQKVLEQELNQSVIWHHTAFCRLIMGNLIKTFQKTAYGQNRANQVITACALERYRLAKGRFPEKLDELLPTYSEGLPMDVCNGHTLKYKLLPDGQFTLYSVGWNEKDDGGMVVMKPDGSDIDSNQGDWVFPAYVAK